MGTSTCGVCECAGSLRELPGFRALPRVTSDCKPWPAGGELVVCTQCGAIQKPTSAVWLDECRQIYGNYEIYHLSQGAEQVIFTPDGVPVPRSQVLVEYVLGHRALPDAGRLLDIGCGNGAALARFGNALPGWRLCGHELSDGALPQLRRIPGFEALYTGAVGDVAGHFDLITAIHSLEHMPCPGTTLVDAREHLADGGTLFIQVPDAETSPFDLLVADHRTHFSRATLRQAVTRRGIAVDAIDNKVLPKEISLIGRRDAGVAEVAADPHEGIALAEHAIAWLEAVLAAAQAASREGPFGIFGSSVSGIWLYGALHERTAFFVDEDTSRIGRHFDGKPILAPQDVPAGATVFVPLIHAIAARVIDRLSGLPVRFVAPRPVAI